MNSDVYHLVTVNDGKSDNAEIVNVFSNMAVGYLKCDLKLLNYCDEMPVSYGTSISTVEKDSVELAVHEHQAVMMKYHKSTLIKSKHFHKELGVHCYAAYVSIPKKTAVLHNFAYAQIRAERRNAVRVNVRGIIPVKFCYENVNIKGNMLTISGTGLSINSDIVPATNTDQPGRLFFTFAGIPLDVPGSFVRTTKSRDDGHICIFQMKPDIKCESTVGRFIYERQVEIIQSLKEGVVAE